MLDSLQARSHTGDSHFRLVLSTLVAAPRPATHLTREGPTSLLTAQVARSRRTWTGQPVHCPTRPSRVHPPAFFLRRYALSLRGHSLLALLSLLTAVTPPSLVLLWPRLRGPRLVRAGARLLLVALAQISAVALV